MKLRFSKIYKHPILNKLINKETLAYGIAGLLTTLVNFISYELIYRLYLSNLTANALAWLIAVTFAYLVNKSWVFRSKSTTRGVEAIKITKFFSARLLTLGIEQLGIYFFVERLGIYRWIIKGSLSILVIILNYIFSKLFIFNINKV